MAKKKVSSSSGIGIGAPVCTMASPYTPASKHDRQLKEGGDAFTSEKDFETSLCTIPAGTEYKECNDGFYAIFINGEKAFYRIGPRLIPRIKK